MLHLRVPAVLVLVAGLLATTAAPALAADVPPEQPMQVGTALPPGNSGFFSVPGQAQGMATGDPGAYGEHVDDQREMFWDGDFKDGRFKAPVGTPDEPKAGVRIYEDDKGVKQVYGDTSFDTWFGAGYAAGQQRLFLADAVRRMGRGTFAELVGPSGVPVDVQARTLTYSQADYDAMFAALPQSSKEVVEGYAAGMDAWIQHVRTTPTDLPAEYALLQTLPESWTVTDSLAAGVLITRTVASAGGDEFREVETLRTLGGLAGLGAFTDLRWQSDEKATVSVPTGEGRFDNAVVPAAQRDAVLRKSAAYALALPKELASGPGTGAHPEPAVPTGVGLPPLVQSSLAKAAETLVAWGKGLHGGSYAFAVAPERTSTGAAMLVSGPQLGYSYPTQLWEIEVHGGGYDARGSTVPGLPTVGIGYGKRVAWGLTTGNSKTIDSFIETTRRTADGALEYLHQGTWKPADCRTETIRYRTAQQGVPLGLPVLTEDVEVCRTVHGPIAAYSADGTKARSVQYAMYRRELETINGILQWNRADDLAEFEQGMRMVTWNENTVYADADGHIAYWHPGLFPRRSTSWDSRFPAPGTGEHDRRGFVPFEQLPHVVDPGVGYVANWNNKPATGWIDEYLEPASSRSAGKAARIQVIHDLLASQPRLTPEALRATEYRLGNLDQRVPEFKGLLTAVPPRTAAQRQAIALLKAWDGTTYGPRAGTSEGDYTDGTVTDGPAKTLWMRYMDDLRDEVLAALPDDVVVQSDVVASHVYDASPADNLVLRVLNPSASALRPARDYLAGRTPAIAMLAALDKSIAALTAQYGADPATWRMPHERRAIDSLTGVIGPSLTMPYMDRGSWVHVIAFTEAAAAPSTDQPRTAPRPSDDALPATGPSALPALVGVALLAGWAWRRRVQSR
ncbi:MAG: Penicillin acylase [Frankiales bacterium]|nr:Penicillin acylase [Frankiales bacterium]